MKTSIRLFRLSCTLGCGPSIRLDPLIVVSSVLCGSPTLCMAALVRVDLVSIRVLTSLVLVLFSEQMLWIWL